MASQTLYFSIPAPPGGALSEQGPGSPSLPISNPLGTGIVANTFSNPSASLELRVVVNSPTGGGQNINSVAAAGNVWSNMGIVNALERLRYFIRQRGYIGGSGGPVASGGSFSDTTHTGTTTSGSSTITALSANANTLGWKPGMLISGTNIPAGTSILTISADGLQVFLSANATGSGTLVALIVSSATAVPPM